MVSTSTKSCPRNGKGGPEEDGIRPQGFWAEARADVPLQLALPAEIVGRQPAVAPLPNAVRSNHGGNTTPPALGLTLTASSTLKT